MHVGAARQHADAVSGGQQPPGHCPGAGKRALLALTVGVRRGEAECHGLAGDLVREDSEFGTCVDMGGNRPGERLGRQDHPAASTAERLVDRGRDDVRDGDRIRMQARRDQPGEVRHIDQQVRADLVGDRAEAREVEDPGVGRPARQDQPRPAL